MSRPRGTASYGPSTPSSAVRNTSSASAVTEAVLGVALNFGQALWFARSVGVSRTLVVNPRDQRNLAERAISGCDRSVPPPPELREERADGVIVGRFESRECVHGRPSECSHTRVSSRFRNHGDCVLEGVEPHIRRPELRGTTLRREVHGEVRRPRDPDAVLEPHVDADLVRRKKLRMKVVGYVVGHGLTSHTSGISCRPSRGQQVAQPRDQCVER